jgi:hypothetical protein
MQNPNPDKMTLPLARKILPIDFHDLSLNPRELKFVAVYCTNGFDTRHAAQVAGFASKRKEFDGRLTAGILNRPGVAEAIRRFMEKMISPYKDRLNMELLEVYYRRATYDIATFYDDHGRILPLNNIPIEWRCCIDGLDTQYYGKDADVKVMTYKLPSRDQALGVLWKMVTMVADPDSPALPGDAREAVRAIFDRHRTATNTDVKTRLQSIAKPPVPRVIRPTANDA